MNFRERMVKIINDIDSLIAEIKAKMEAGEIPEHPEINRLGERVFTLKASALEQTNWSAEYYDWAWQCKKIIEILDLIKPETFPIVLDKIFDTKIYKLGKERIKFHPDLLIKVQNKLNWLTKKQTKEYLANSNHCPICGEDLEGEDITIDNGSAWQNCSCYNPKCEASWQDIYKLVDVQLNN